MHLGERDRAREQANAALPAMERLGAKDDAVQLRSLLVMCAVSEGRLADAEAELERIGAVPDDEVFGGVALRRIGGAEIALARGDHAGGLRAYRECATSMGELRLPGVPGTGLEPWATVGYSTALAAHAYYATGADEAHGRDLFELCRERARRLLDLADPYLDFPAAGLVLFGLGAWGLLRGADAVEPSLRLLVLADRFAYNRTVPTMAWERVSPHAERRAPGRIAQLREVYGDRRPRDLLDEARRYRCRL